MEEMECGQVKDSKGKLVRVWWDRKSGKVTVGETGWNGWKKVLQDKAKDEPCQRIRYRRGSTGSRRIRRREPVASA